MVFWLALVYNLVNASSKSPLGTAYAFMLGALRLPQLPSYAALADV